MQPGVEKGAHCHREQSKRRQFLLPPLSQGTLDKGEMRAASKLFSDFACMVERVWAIWRDSA
jgi:hypothetical protein